LELKVSVKVPSSNSLVIIRSKSHSFKIIFSIFVNFYIIGNIQTKATAANKAASRINTTTEFSGAFKNWFASLGYKPENNTVTISRVQQLIKQAMTELGYK